MADTATATTTTSTVNKKKYRNNKKKTQQAEKLDAEPAASKIAAAHQPNGHVKADENNGDGDGEGEGDGVDDEDADADVALINDLLQQVQLCNGHGKEQQMVKAELMTATHTINGHANKESATNNNNHINNNNNSSNNNNDFSINISNNNNSSSSNNSSISSSSTKAKNKSQSAKGELTESEPDPEENEQQATSVIRATVVTTSKTTAKTQTTTATKTKTTAMAIATQGSVKDEAASTSAAAAAGAALLPELLHQSALEPAISADEIVYKEYEAEHQMHDIMRLIQAELSEPYSIYTYRYFIYNWPKLCFLASHDNQYVGAIVCKLDMHMNVRRGYIAMLAVRKEYRKLKIGTTLVTKAIEGMLADNADEVVLETEMRNEPALRLYENLGFVRDKRLFRYYLNGVDALRLKLWFR